MNPGPLHHWRLLRPYRALLLLAFLAMATESAAGLREPWPLKLVYDNVLAVLLIAVVGAVGAYFQKYLSTAVGQALMRRAGLRVVGAARACSFPMRGRGGRCHAAVTGPTAARCLLPRLGVLAMLLQAGAAGAQSPAATGTPPDEAASIRFTMDDRPTLHLGTLGEIRFRGRVEVTTRTPQSDEGLEAETRWQTRRLQIEGRLFDRIEFEVSREFGDADEPERDAFLNLRLHRGFELQAGRFKMPLGRDALTGGANLDFVYRSLAGRQLAPGRDVGVMAHGRSPGRVVSYEAGYFVGDGDNARTSQTQGGRHALAARALVTPFAGRRASPLAALQAGVAVAASEVDERLGLRGLTVFRDGVFFDRVVVNGRRLRRGLEAAWNAGPFSLAWEHLSVRDERIGMGFDGASLPAVRASGWYVAGTWTLTGEVKRGRVEPRSRVGRGGLGALEVAARYERLAFEPLAPRADAPALVGLDTPGNAERVLTIGLAWSLSRYVKVQVNGVFEVVDDPQRSPAPRSDGRFPSAVAQFQVAM